MKKNNQGLSLIELLVVVAMIGILSAFVIPQYHQYTANSQAAVIVEFATQVKKEVSLCYQQTLALSKCTEGRHGIRKNNEIGEFIRSMQVNTNGKIFIKTKLVSSKGFYFDLLVTPSIDPATDRLSWKASSNFCNINNGGFDCSIIES